MKLLIITFYKLKMMLSDRVFFAAMVIIPLFITVATGYALRYEKMNIIPLGFVDEDGTSYSKTLIDRLSGKEGFRITLTGRKTAIRMLKDNKIEGAFIIKEGFEEKIMQGDNKELIDMAKAPSSVAVSYVQEIVAGEVMRLIANNEAVRQVRELYRKNKIVFDDSLVNAIVRYCDSKWEPKPLMTVNYQEMEGNTVKVVKGVSTPASTATSTGIIIVFIMFYILFSSGWLVEERINGTLKRLVSGPNALGYSFAGNISALTISGMFQVALFSLVNRFVFDVDLFPGIWSYLVFAVYLLSVISISMFLSSVLKTPAQLQAAAPVFALLTGFMGGCFWNFADISKEVKQLSMLTPQGWALDGINMLLVDPDKISAVILPVIVLLSISSILLPASYLIIKKQVGN